MKYKVQYCSAYHEVLLEEIKEYDGSAEEMLCSACEKVINRYQRMSQRLREKIPYVTVHQYRYEINGNEAKVIDPDDTEEFNIREIIVVQPI